MLFLFTFFFIQLAHSLFLSFHCRIVRNKAAEKAKSQGAHEVSPGPTPTAIVSNSPSPNVGYTIGSTVNPQIPQATTPITPTGANGNKRKREDEGKKLNQHFNEIFQEMQEIIIFISNGIALGSNNSTRIYLYIVYNVKLIFHYLLPKRKWFIFLKYWKTRSKFSQTSSQVIQVYSVIIRLVPPWYLAR